MQQRTVLRDEQQQGEQEAAAEPARMQATQP
jgi:hypothetical protein